MKKSCLVKQLTFNRLEYMMTDEYSNNANFEKSISLIPLVTILFRRKWIISSFFFSVVGVITLWSFFSPAIFRVSSKLMIEREMDSAKAFLFRMNLPTGYEQYDWIYSEIDIIKSHPVAMRVVDSLHLAQIWQDKKSHTEITEKERFERATKILQKKLNVMVSKKSNVIEVSYETKNPKLGVEIVNKVIDAYINYRSQISDETEAYNFFEKQLSITDEKIRELEHRLAEYKQSNEMISPETQREILLTRLAEYEKSLTDVRIGRITKEAKLTLIKEHLRRGQELSIPTTEASDSPSREKHIAKLKGELLDLEIEREQLAQKYTAQYEEVIKLDRQIAMARKRINSEIHQIVDIEATSIRALRIEEGILQNSVENTTREIKDLAQKEYEFSQLSRGIDDNREVYSMLLKQREEARISLAKLQKEIRIRVISPAIVPMDPAKPRKKLNIALAFFLGIVGGVSLALFIEYFDHSINSPYELEKYTELPVLGSVRDMKINASSHDRKIGAKITTVKMLPYKSIQTFHY